MTMRLRSSVAVLAVTLVSIGGCGRADDATKANAPTPVAEGATAEAPAPSPSAAQAVEIKSTKDGLEFDYQWPAAAAAIPELDTWLRGNAETLRAKATKEASEDKASAAKAGYPFHDHSYTEHFKTVADTPRALVLQSDGYTFTGGAHGMPFNTVIIWDKAAKQRVATGALVDVPAFKRLANDRFCKELDRQREEKRGEPVKPGGSDGISEFDSCVDMAKQALLPISQGGKTLDTFRVVIAPYEAGPYAEGTYTIDLPFDGKTIAVVKPAWKDAFAAR